MDLNLKNKTAFISGSTSGIGYTTAKILLQEGMKVYINGRSQKNLKKSLDQLKKDVKGANVYGIKADFLDQKDVHKIVNKLQEVDVLINNVGIYTSKSFFETGIEIWEDQFYVNIMSGVTLCKHYLKGMINRNWGRIIFISSECSYIVPSDMISYSATKSAIHAVSRGISNMTKGTGVTSNVIVPGSTLSKGAEKFISEKAKSENKSAREIETNFFRNERQNSLLERFATTEEVANTIAYLCSPNSSATNGSVIKVDGGSSGGIF